MGEWMAVNGETVYATEAGDIAQQEWGCTTRKGNRLFVHIFELEGNELFLPLECKVVKATKFSDGSKLSFRETEGGIILEVGEVKDAIDHIVELRTK